MRRHRLTRRLVWIVISLAIVAGLLEIANVVALHMTEDTLAGRAMRATGAHSASVSLSGWPFLYDVVAEGKVDGADVHLTDVPVGQVQVKSLDVHLGQVAMSRHSFLADHALQLTSVTSATVTAEVTASELSAAAGRTVKLLANGVIEVPDAAGGVTDEAWADAAEHYDEEQLGALVALIALINVYNRLNVITRQPAGDYQPGQWG